MASTAVRVCAAAMPCKIATANIAQWAWRNVVCINSLLPSSSRLLIMLRKRGHPPWKGVPKGLPYHTGLTSMLLARHSFTVLGHA